MNDKELRSILAVAETGSIRKAAALLKKNTSSLGRTVRRVEAELDVTLFKRTPSGLIPTPEGAVYIGTAAEILHLYENMKKQAGESE